MKTLNLLVTIFFLCFSSVIYAQDVSDLFKTLDTHYQERPPLFPESFSSLTSKTVYDKYIPGGVKIHFNESDSAVLDINIKGFYNNSGKFIKYDPNSGGTDSSIRVLKTHINSKSDVQYYIDFNAGLSVDPHFIIMRAKGDSAVFVGETDWCLDIFIPGDGFIYTAGHTNNMFDTRRRYSVENDSLIETQQPFYYVGLKTVTTKEIKLSSTEDANDSFITIPAETPITVLINKGDSFLISDPFGITGWINIEHTYYTPIKNLIFRGD